MRSVNGVGIAAGICTFCDEEGGWSEAIDREVPIPKPLPANHPDWKRREALYAKHEQPVALLTYDDGGWQLCARHLRELADAVASAVVDA